MKEPYKTLLAAFERRLAGGSWFYWDIYCCSTPVGKGYTYLTDNVNGFRLVIQQENEHGKTRRDR